MNKQGLTQSIEVVQSGDTDIIVRRNFSHSPAKVWRAITDPTLIPHWMASVDAMTHCEMDLRPGGSFRYEWSGREGLLFYFSGPILAVEAPHHMTHVEYFNGDTGSGTIVTTDIRPFEGGSRMTMVMRYADATARAAAIEMGMTDGFDSVYDRLAGLLARS